MIVREVIKRPELLEDGDFDFFNDAKDTRLWLNSMIANANSEDKIKYTAVKEKLEHQTQAYWDNRSGKTI